MTSTINAADTAWMISATALVLMMSIPGLALFYCGMVRKKNVLATMAQTLLCVCVGSLLWAAFCYSLTFTGDGAFIGTLDRVFLSRIGMTTTSPLPSTGPTIGRPSAVTVASASRHMPCSRSLTCSAPSRRSGVWMLSRCSPAFA